MAAKQWSPRALFPNERLATKLLVLLVGIFPVHSHIVVAALTAAPKLPSLKASSNKSK